MVLVTAQIVHVVQLRSISYAIVPQKLSLGSSILFFGWRLIGSGTWAVFKYIKDMFSIIFTSKKTTTNTSDLPGKSFPLHHPTHPKTPSFSTLFRPLRCLWCPAPSHRSRNTWRPESTKSATTREVKGPQLRGWLAMCWFQHLHPWVH